MHTFPEIKMKYTSVKFQQPRLENLFQDYDSVIMSQQSGTDGTSVTYEIIR